MFTAEQLNDVAFINRLRLTDFERVREITALTALLLAADVQRNDQLWEHFQKQNLFDFVSQPTRELDNLLKILLNLQNYEASLNFEELFQRAVLFRPAEYYSSCVDSVSRLLCLRFNQRLCELVICKTADLSPSDVIDVEASQRCEVVCLTHFLRTFQSQTTSSVLLAYQRRSGPFFAVLHTMLRCRIEVPELLNQYFQAEIVNSTAETMPELFALLNMCSGEYECVLAFAQMYFGEQSKSNQDQILRTLRQRSETDFLKFVGQIYCQNNVQQSILGVVDTLSSELCARVLLNYMQSPDKEVRQAAFQRLHLAAPALDGKAFLQTACAFACEDFDALRQALETDADAFCGVFMTVADLCELQWLCERLQACCDVCCANQGQCVVPGRFIAALQQKDPLRAFVVQVAVASAVLPEFDGQEASQQAQSQQKSSGASQNNKTSAVSEQHAGAKTTTDSVGQKDAQISRSKKHAAKALPIVHTHQPPVNVKQLKNELFRDVQADLYILELLKRRGVCFNPTDFKKLFQHLLERLNGNEYLVDLREEATYCPNYAKPVPFVLLELLLSLRALSVQEPSEDLVVSTSLRLSDLSVQSDKKASFDYGQLDEYKSLHNDAKFAIECVFSKELDEKTSSQCISEKSDVFRTACVCEHLVLKARLLEDKVKVFQLSLSDAISAVTKRRNTLSRDYQSDEALLKYLLLVSTTLLRLTEISSAHHLETEALIPLLQLLLSDFQPDLSLVEQSFSALASQICNFLLRQLVSNLQLPKILCVVLPFLAFVKNKRIKADRQAIFFGLKAQSFPQLSQQLVTYCKQYSECYAEKAGQQAKFQQIMPAYVLYYVLFAFSSYLTQAGASGSLLSQLATEVCGEFCQVCLVDQFQAAFALACLDKVQTKHLYASTAELEAVYKQVCESFRPAIAAKAQGAPALEIQVSYPGGLFGK